MGGGGGSSGNSSMGVVVMVVMGSFLCVLVIRSCPFWAIYRSAKVVLGTGVVFSLFVCHKGAHTNAVLLE